MNRRQFAAASAAVATPMVFAAEPKEQKLRVGLVGCGWYGKCDLWRLLQVAPTTEIVSLCDVDGEMLADAAGMASQKQASKKKPRTYGDYREMLKEKDLDVVMVETPDHWHALPAIAAMEVGADLWVQKPVGVDVMEGKAMLDAARKHKKVVQVVTQRRSTPHLIDAKEKVIKEGLLGTIGHVEICCYYEMRERSNPKDADPPAHLDYEMWTGPAPKRPYNPLVHPRKWRAFMEYGNGIVGDMCIHMYDMVRWMLDLGWPSKVSSAGGIYVEKASKANITDTQTATFEHPKFNVVWTHRTYGSPPDKDYPWAAIIYGEKGTLKASVNKFEFVPKGAAKATVSGNALFEEDKYPEDKTEKDLERHVASAIRRHWLDFLKAREDRSKPVADIEQGHISSASCILANLSQKLGRTISWDPMRHECVGDDDATKLLKRPYRKPWIHPAG